MTDYTNLKRALQKLGFKVIERIEEKHIKMSDGEYTFTIKGYDEWTSYHCENSDGMPVSWYPHSKKGYEYKLVGNRNFHLDEVLITTEKDRELAKALFKADAKIEGHYWPK